MTDKEMEMRLYLNRAFYADKKIRALEKLIDRHKEQAQGLTICCEGNDTGVSGSSKNGTEDVLMRYLEMEEKLTSEIRSLQLIESEIRLADRLRHLWEAR